MNLPNNVKYLDPRRHKEISDYNGKAIYINGAWSSEIENFILNNNITVLFLINTMGWATRDYSFLYKLKQIEYLAISSIQAINLKSIEGMENLARLRLRTSINEKINFSKLCNLRECYIEWSRNAETIFNSKSLKILYLDEAKTRDLSSLGHLHQLEELTVGNSTLEGISWLKNLGNLRKLSLLNCRKVTDYTAVSKCTQLEWLQIDGTKKVTNLDFIQKLTKLSVLLIESNSEIETLRPVRHLKCLKAFGFFGKTRIADGNLSYLEKLPNLSMLAFTGKQHYTHKLVKPWNWNNFETPDTLLKKKPTVSAVT